ncbi:hypothetical protein K461DRAFT_71397 [Myriangium duriaei CBS 260.36]|uniref:Uncharacterized protein n=1 Tax=Myriangium duriaei CBS 260.36 TaxID=1168546 RepID=A0A9P4MC25_9PEZI|nr:hypothetical protein K461DRAFT_71397 [Myriangium duriaei CBS 260.36]
MQKEERLGIKDKRQRWATLLARCCVVLEGCRGWCQGTTGEMKVLRGSTATGNPKDQRSLTAINKRLFGNKIEGSTWREMKKTRHGCVAALPRLSLCGLLGAFHEMIAAIRCSQGRLALGTAAGAEPGNVAVK